MFDAWIPQPSLESHDCPWMQAGTPFQTRVASQFIPGPWSISLGLGAPFSSKNWKTSPEQRNCKMPLVFPQLETLCQVWIITSAARLGAVPIAAPRREAVHVRQLQHSHSAAGAGVVWQWHVAQILHGSEAPGAQKPLAFRGWFFCVCVCGCVAVWLLFCCWAWVTLGGGAKTICRSDFQLGPAAGDFGMRTACARTRK